MDAIDALVTRQTAITLGEPAPPPEVVERVLAAATHVPDHGKLRPWRFRLIEGAALRRFGDLLAEALRARDPDTPAPLLDKERAKPLRAPLVIAVAAAVQHDHPKIPALEQIISAGCAVHAMTIGFHALGFASAWKTGSAAYDARVKRGLGFADTDEIVGFLYVGTDAAPIPPKPNPDWRDLTAPWTGEDSAPAG